MLPFTKYRIKTFLLNSVSKLPNTFCICISYSSTSQTHNSRFYEPDPTYHLISYIFCMHITAEVPTDGIQDQPNMNTH